MPLNLKMSENINETTRHLKFHFIIFRFLQIFFCASNFTILFSQYFAAWFLIKLLLN